MYVYKLHMYLCKYLVGLNRCLTKQNLTNKSRVMGGMSSLFIQDIFLTQNCLFLHGELAKYCSPQLLSFLHSVFAALSLHSLHKSKLLCVLLLPCFAQISECTGFCY